jgi:hypothetical protein
MGAQVTPTDIRSALINNGVDPDLLREFLEEQIEMNRSIDDGLKSTIGATEFYKRETKYTKLELFLVHLNKT